MKKFGYALSALAIVGFSSLAQANEWKEVGQDSFESLDEKAITQKTVVEIPAEKKYYTTSDKQSSSVSSTVIRLGLANSGDIDYTVTNDDGDEIFSGTSTDSEDGWDVSVIFGVDSSEGFDYRGGFTLQSLDESSVSTMAVLGECEWAYNVNQYVSPFIGFNAGLGSIDVDDASPSFHFGFFAGISGDVYENFGYYIKLESSGKGYILSSDYEDSDLMVVTSKVLTRLGVSYRF